MLPHHLRDKRLVCGSLCAENNAPGAAIQSRFHAGSVTQTTAELHTQARARNTPQRIEIAWRTLECPIEIHNVNPFRAISGEGTGRLSRIVKISSSLRSNTLFEAHATPTFDVHRRIDIQHDEKIVLPLKRAIERSGFRETLRKTIADNFAMRLRRKQASAAHLSDFTQKRIV
jgi:hypothetical protein